MYTNKSALDDALQSMQRRIVQAVVGCGGVVTVAGGLLVAPNILSEASVNAALARLAEPVRSVERMFAPTRGGTPDWADGTAAVDLARQPMPAAPEQTVKAMLAAMSERGAPAPAKAERPKHAAERPAPERAAEAPAPAIRLASVDPAIAAEIVPPQPPAVTRPPLNEEDIPETVYQGPDALKLVMTPVPLQRPADLPWSNRPRFKTPAELLGLTGKARARAQHCLTQAVYFESRSEPYRGQVAVAQVVMNRVFSPYYPGEVCAVVFQNAHRHLSCQFTFTCEGKSLRVTEHGAWRRAKTIAQQALDGEIWRPEVAKATHYHADYVSPKWASEMRTLAKHGRHIFYRPHRWGDGRGEAGWVMVHKSPIPRARPVEVAAKPITVAAVRVVED